MDYSFWYDLATYGNQTWKGNFSPKEVAGNAKNYFIDWKNSVKTKKIGFIICEVIKLLQDDNGEEAREFLETIEREINKF